MHTVLGDRFLPLYEMVSFSTIPYDDARKRARWQWRLLVTFSGFGIITTSFIMLIVFIMLSER